MGRHKKIDISGVYCADSTAQMQDLEEGSIDLTVTSPPYGKLRTYSGHDFNFEPMAKQLWRVTSEGGVLVWVVGDMLVKGSETGNSFRQALAFMDLGFRLHDTMIYHKTNPIPRRQRRYTQQFEYMFVFSKGEPKVWNPIMEPCKYAGVKSTGKYYETPDTEMPYRGSGKIEKKIADQKVAGNVWSFFVGRNTAIEKKANASNKKVKKEYHPAVMNMELAERHIKTWSNEGDLVFDPMCGSGTTLIAAKKLRRRFLGFDIEERYVKMAARRIEETCEGKEEKEEEEALSKTS